ncbi:hypothetical protein KR093_004319 [Drosophila rubida]|uniref:C2H2-type domain-containing protein n=1 Tax=Drosophila rubida TaxID=30044 RepID=A0AAD4K6W0_9MUSC|nr:hypothetical protein KR093_004319 [Drosophila rubida]
MSAIIDIGCVKVEPPQEDEEDCIEIDIGPVKIEPGTSIEVSKTVHMKQLPRAAPATVGGRPNQCPHCPRSFEMRSELGIHLQIHTSNLLYKCCYCPNSFSHKSIYTLHMFGHTGQFPYQCTECKSGFLRQFEYKKHLQLHKKRPELPPPSPAKTPIKLSECKNKLNFTFKCPHCPRDLRSNDELAKHLRTHSDGRRRKECYSLHCPHCPRDCKSSQELALHLQSHSDNYKPKGRNHTLQCPRCPRGFKSAEDLAIHLQIHSDRLSHKCPYCPSSFSHKTIYMAHLCEHTGAFPYKCYKCAQGFMKKLELKKHLMKHYEMAGEKAQILSLNCIRREELIDLTCTTNDQADRLQDNEVMSFAAVDAEVKRGKTIKEDATNQSSEVDDNEQLMPLDAINIDTLKEEPCPEEDLEEQTVKEESLGVQSLCEDPLKAEALQAASLKQESQENDSYVEEALRDKEPLEDGPQECSSCHQEFLDLNELRLHENCCLESNHQRTRSDESPFSCPHCSCSFSQSSALRMHLREHPGRQAGSEGPGTNQLKKKHRYKCSYCTQTFAHHYQFIAHVTQHTGKRLHTCSQCGKIFRGNYDLKKHLKSHSEDR